MLTKFLRSGVALGANKLQFAAGLTRGLSVKVADDVSKAPLEVQYKEVGSSGRVMNLSAGNAPLP